MLQRMISETVDSVQRDDPAHGDWRVDERELNVWVDASYLAIGVTLERYETVLEDACWLRPENNVQPSRTGRRDIFFCQLRLSNCLETGLLLLFNYSWDFETSKVHKICPELEFLRVILLSSQRSSHL